MAITEADVYQLAPYAETLGVRLPRMEADGVVGTLEHSRALSTVNGGLHGGALMGLADVTAAVCAVLNAAPGAMPATISSNTSFLRPARGGVSALATAVHRGGSMVTVQVDVTDGSGALCARVIQTVATRGGVPDDQRRPASASAAVSAAPVARAQPEL